ncbi:MAG: hypothetical protein AAGB01_11800, partial [Cyanobacteria bacterium P01_F01_bin.42]
MAPSDSAELNTVVDFQARQKSHGAQNLAQAIDRTAETIQSCLSSKLQTLDKPVQQELCKFLIILRKIKRLSASKKFQKSSQGDAELRLVVKNIAIACDVLENNGGLDFTAQIRADAETAIERFNSPLTARISRSFNRFCS